MHMATRRPVTVPVPRQGVAETDVMDPNFLFERDFSTAP